MVSVNEPAGRAFSLFTSSLTILTGAYFNLITTHEFGHLDPGLQVGGERDQPGLVFPIEPRVLFKRPYLRWGGILAGRSGHLLLYHAF